MQLMEKMNEERNQDATAAAASSLLTGVVVVESGVWTTRVMRQTLEAVIIQLRDRNEIRVLVFS